MTTSNEPSIVTQLRTHLAAGSSPDEAATKVLAPYGDQPLAVFARPAVVAAAYRLARQATRQVENAVLSGGAADADERVAERADARERLRVAEFHLGDGRKVTWDEATPEQHEARAAWQRTLADRCVVDAVRHETAAELIREHKVRTLGEIDGWQELLAERCERSGGKSSTGKRSQAA